MQKKSTQKKQKTCTLSYNKLKSKFIYFLLFFSGLILWPENNSDNKYFCVWKITHTYFLVVGPLEGLWVTTKQTNERNYCPYNYLLCGCLCKLFALKKTCIIPAQIFLADF